MKDVGRLVHHVVVEVALFLKIGHGHIAGGFLAQANDARRIVGQQIRIDTAQVEVRQVPGRAQPWHAGQHRFNISRSQEDDRAGQNVEHGFLLARRKQSLDHGR